MTKRCASCSQEKPVSDFYAARGADGFRNFCIECWRDKERCRRARAVPLAVRVADLQLRQQLEDEFWPLVKRTDGCWPWRGPLDRRGYGRLYIQGRHEKTHRIAWTLACGAIPDGLGVLHRCDNPPCVRLDHLFLGTQLENVRDMTAKGRRASFAGENHGRAKLTRTEVEVLRAERVAGTSVKALMQRYGISATEVRSIAAGRRWA